MYRLNQNGTREQAIPNSSSFDMCNTTTTYDDDTHTTSPSSYGDPELSGRSNKSPYFSSDQDSGNESLGQCPTSQPLPGVPSARNNDDTYAYGQPGLNLPVAVQGSHAVVLPSNSQPAYLPGRGGLNLAHYAYAHMQDVEMMHKVDNSFNQPHAGQSNAFTFAQAGTINQSAVPVKGQTRKIPKKAPVQIAVDSTGHAAMMGAEDDEAAEDAGPGVESQPPPKRVAKNATGRRRNFATSNTTPQTMTLTYTPDADLDSSEACRAYLAYPDSRTLKVVDIEEDDWQDVKQNRAQEFVGMFFEALTHEFHPNPPSGVTLSPEQHEDYTKQQHHATGKLYDQLKTPAQLKAAKAQCYVLFETAIKVSEKGVDSDTHKLYEHAINQGRMPDKRDRVDIKSISSERMQKIARVIKANKLIAADVVDGKNFYRICVHPEYYLVEKITMRKSNQTRGVKNKEVMAVVEEGKANMAAAGAENVGSTKKTHQSTTATGSAKKASQPVARGKKRNGAEAELDSVDGYVEAEMSSDESDGESGDSDFMNEAEWQPTKRARTDRMR